MYRKSLKKGRLSIAPRDLTISCYTNTIKITPIPIMSGNVFSIRTMYVDILFFTNIYNITGNVFDPRLIYV